MKKLSASSGRWWVTVIVTMGLALLSGHLVQSFAVKDDPWTETSLAIALPVAPTVSSTLSTPPRFDDRVRETRYARAGNCRPTLTLEETPNGDLVIGLSAPCNAHQPFEVRINSLVADVETDASGKWDQRMPPLAPEVTVEIRMGNYTLTEQATFSQADAQQLVALAWTGPQMFFIRAESTATDIGETQAAFTRVGSGGGASFELFSSSALTRAGAGIVRLSVETNVTEANCGQHISTLAYQTSYLGELRPTEIAYTMPDCDRVGDVVRLQNLLRDMRLASR